eukprot:365334-Chlamydomonas_euryale.AAC.13
MKPSRSGLRLGALDAKQGWQAAGWKLSAQGLQPSIQLTGSRDGLPASNGSICCVAGIRRVWYVDNVEG